jgi:hypothetical protein
MSLQLTKQGYSQDSIQKKFTEPLGIFWMVSFFCCFLSAGFGAFFEVM